MLSYQEKLLHLLQESANFEESLVIIFSNFIENKLNHLDFLRQDEEKEIKNILKILRDDSIMHKSACLRIISKLRKND